MQKQARADSNSLLLRGGLEKPRGLTASVGTAALTSRIRDGQMEVYRDPMPKTIASALWIWAITLGLGGRSSLFSIKVPCGLRYSIRLTGAGRGCSTPSLTTWCGPDSCD